MANLFGKRKEGLVSIVIPTYNRQDYIEETLNSIKNQNYLNIEVIIIDDCSTDNTEQVVNRWKEDNDKAFKNFIYLKLPRNLDEEWANNIGFFMTRGEYIAIQHSDDISHVDRIQKQVDFLFNNPDSAAVGVKYAVFKDCIDNIIGEAEWLCFDRSIIEMNYKHTVNHCICTGTILFRAYVLENIIGFKRVGDSNDWHFILQLINNDYIVDNIEEILYYYRSHNGQRSLMRLSDKSFIYNKRRQMEGMVSVVLPLYKKQNNIVNAMKALLNQSYDNVEIIVVDDLLDSRIETNIKECYEKYISENPIGQVKNLTYFKLPKKVGYPWIYNIGAYLSIGQYIVFHGDNGVSDKLKLEKQVDFLKDNSIYSAVGTNFDNNNNFIKYDDAINNSYEVELMPCVNIYTVMLRADVINSNGGFNESLPGREAFEYISRLLSDNYKVQNLKEVLYYEKEIHK